MAYRLSKICSILKVHVDACHQEIGYFSLFSFIYKSAYIQFVLFTNIGKLDFPERNLHKRLLSLADEVQFDNQEFLRLLFPMKDYLPLKDCSTQEKVLCSIILICFLRKIFTEKGTLLNK